MSKYTVSSYPNGSARRYQIRDGDRLMADVAEERDATVIAAALNFTRMAFRVLRSIRDDYERATQRSGRQSWATIASGMAGIASVALHDEDLPPELQ